MSVRTLLTRRLYRDTFTRRGDDIVACLIHFEDHFPISHQISLKLSNTSLDSK